MSTHVVCKPGPMRALRLRLSSLARGGPKY